VNRLDFRCRQKDFCGTFNSLHLQEGAVTEKENLSCYCFSGDTAVYENETYKILGRTSVDIIKSGGYKISALDIERHLLEHPDIAEVVVVGVADITWGQKIAAVVVLRQGVSSMDLKDLQVWSAERLPPYQLPTILRVVETIPRNALGKVNKKSLVAELFGNGAVGA